MRLRSEDGRVTTVHIHANKEVPKGLLRKINREDLEISLKKFLEMYPEFKFE
jgi:predicted RNA binding protein YcfA (HicA-like mRNA interferase family)